MQTLVTQSRLSFQAESALLNLTSRMSPKTLRFEWLQSCARARRRKTAATRPPRRSKSAPETYVLKTVLMIKCGVFALFMLQKAETFRGAFRCSLWLRTRPGLLRQHETRLCTLFRLLQRYAYPLCVGLNVQRGTFNCHFS